MSCTYLCLFLFKHISDKIKHLIVSRAMKEQPPSNKIFLWVDSYSERKWEMITYTMIDLKRMVLLNGERIHCGKTVQSHTPLHCIMLQKWENCIEELAGRLIHQLLPWFLPTLTAHTTTGTNGTSKSHASQHRDAIVWSSLRLLICKLWLYDSHSAIYSSLAGRTVTRSPVIFFSTVFLAHALILKWFMISLI